MAMYLITSRTCSVGWEMRADDYCCDLIYNIYIYIYVCVCGCVCVGVCVCVREMYINKYSSKIFEMYLIERGNNGTTHDS